MIRTFIAVELNPETRAALSLDIRVLSQKLPRIKWVDPANIHLTLKFLGDVKENDLDELFSALDEALAATSPFVIEVTGLGAFPNWRNPRVVWAGCGDGAAEASDLARLVDDACADLGYEPEKRPFNPHLTLGRVKLPADAHGLTEAVDRLDPPDYGFIDVDEVQVFMSELRRFGPVYSPMHTIALAHGKIGR